MPTKGFLRCEQSVFAGAATQEVEFKFPEPRLVVGMDVGISAGANAEVSIGIFAEDQAQLDGKSVPLTTLLQKSGGKFVLDFQPFGGLLGDSSRSVKVTIVNSATAKTVSVVLHTVPVPMRAAG